MVRSKQIMNDRRFLNLARVQQAKYHNVKIRFKGLSTNTKTQEESKDKESSNSKSIEKAVLSDYAGYIEE